MIPSVAFRLSILCDLSELDSRQGFSLSAIVRPDALNHRRAARLEDFQKVFVSAPDFSRVSTRFSACETGPILKMEWGFNPWTATQ